MMSGVRSQLQTCHPVQWLAMPVHLILNVSEVTTFVCLGKNNSKSVCSVYGMSLALQVRVNLAQILSWKQTRLSPCSIEEENIENMKTEMR